MKGDEASVSIDPNLMHIYSVHRRQQAFDALPLDVRLKYYQDRCVLICGGECQHRLTQAQRFPGLDMGLWHTAR